MFPPSPPNRPEAVKFVRDFTGRTKASDSLAGAGAGAGASLLVLAVSGVDVAGF